jgi:hypothetical protein
MRSLHLKEQHGDDDPTEGEGFPDGKQQERTARDTVDGLGVDQLNTDEPIRIDILYTSLSLVSY